MHHCTTQRSCQQLRAVKCNAVRMHHFTAAISAAVTSAPVMCATATMRYGCNAVLTGIACSCAVLEGTQRIAHEAHSTRYTAQGTQYSAGITLPRIEQSPPCPHSCPIDQAESDCEPCRPHPLNARHAEHTTQCSPIDHTRSMQPY